MPTRPELPVCFLDWLPSPALILSPSPHPSPICKPCVRERMLLLTPLDAISSFGISSRHPESTSPASFHTRQQEISNKENAVRSVSGTTPLVQGKKDRSVTPMLVRFWFFPLPRFPNLLPTPPLTLSFVKAADFSQGPCIFLVSQALPDTFGVPSLASLLGSCFR